LTDTAYYYIDTHILSKLASILEKEKDTQKYRKLAEEIRKSFRKKIFNPETGKVENNSQTALSCTLYQGLIDNGEKEEVLP
jgi:alpha-L-rhamnosidase